MSDLTERIADLSDASFSPDQIKKLHLLAASAGTGKTYSIQTLYLRLILVEGLTVQQILVVTFTKDATKELRDRLQHVLRDALDYLAGTVQIADPTDRTRKLVDVAKVTPGEGKAKQRLQLALLDFDMAAIYTIHGFCQRVLNRFAFETQQPFDVEPTGDASDEIERLCKDWWRRNVYPMDETFAGFLSESGRFSLKAITTLARKIIGKPDAKLFPEIEGAESIETKIPQMLAEFAGNNPQQEAETTEYPNALPEVRTAVEEIQQQLKTFRERVGAKEWDAALEALLTVTGFQKTIPTACRDKAATLVAACAVFMAKVPQRTQAKTFKYNADSCLVSEKCPDVLQHHTDAISAAAQAMNLAHLVEKFAPLCLYQKKVFNSTYLLCRHILNMSPCSAPDLFEAIKDIAKEGAGIAGKVKVTVETVNPAFEQLKNALYAECGHAVCRAALDVKKQYRQGRPSAATASFDDYLVNLRDALNSEPVGQEGGLVAVLRGEFAAALIDEFQDTDPIQWGIFERLFQDAGIPCFLVGDPKQAIYRFRNGDVETYVKATGEVAEPARYPLKRNHRSEKRLIDAVNQVFMDGDGHKTFGENIDYSEPLSAAGKEKGKSLLVKGEPDPKPFKIILITNSAEKGLPGKHSESARWAYRLTAQEIARILKDGNLKIGGNGVSRKDIAVLVNKHEEGECIAQELGKLNIPSVRQGTGDVWNTDEGRVLWFVLEAVLDSRNLWNVRRALMSAWFGLTVEQIQELNEGKKLPFVAGDRAGDYGLEDWVNVLDQLRDAWLKRGFPAMFRKLTGTLGLKKRLLSLKDNQGQRRLANINHLCEFVDRAIVEDRKTPEGTLAWIRRQFDQETADGGDEVKLRLETDDDAVRIMTIFTSKGLEFPIVFAPTLFMMQPRQYGGVYEFHEGASLRIARKIENDPNSNEAKEKERTEMESEHVRQIYVALTRAVHRTVVVALNDGKADGKAKKGEVQKYRMKGILGRVLRLPMKMVVEDQKEKVVVDTDHAAERFGNVDGVECAVDVNDNETSVEDLPLGLQPGQTLREPGEKPKADTSKGHGSFTSLAPRDQKQSGAAGAVAEGDADSKNRDGETFRQPIEQSEQKPEGIFTFPAGARTGTCWHEIFEDLAFNATDDEIRKMAEEKLKIHGFLKNKAKVQEHVDNTAQMVSNVLKTVLPALGRDESFPLSRVEDRDRRTEWEFSFSSVSGKRTPDLKRAISSHEKSRVFADALGEWNRAIPGGYLTGFIDLLFRKGNRYYIVDWKSNRRRGRQTDFGQCGLKEEIALHSYWLQYLIYTVAVHQFLSDSVTDYSYEAHFGGVYYIFLRGVNGGNDEAGNINGVYADRPPQSLVNDMSRILGDFA
ncbi:MAG: RecBCD enzyme subunit RecB [Nitrospira sp.]|nr:RecBCD enzyme subunit RecB [Nitrospira sp.]